jgi:TnpA family transposase
MIDHDSGMPLYSMFPALAVMLRGMNRHPILSPAQREAIETAHFRLDEREIARYWTLSPQDLLRLERRRRDSNRFGFALQLCLLRFPGWSPKRGQPVPEALVRYLGDQLLIEAPDLEQYFHRPPTRSEHLQEIVDLYGFRWCDTAVSEELTAWMKSQAHRWSTPAGLFLALLEEMRHRQIVLPTLSWIEHLAWRVYRQVEEETLAQLADSLSPWQRSQVDDLLLPTIDPADHTLTWLRAPLDKPGAKTLLDLLDRLDFINGLELDPGWAEGVSPLRLRQLAGRGARHSLQHLRDYTPRKRFGILTAFLLDRLPQLTDELIDLYIRLVGRWFNKADKRRWEVFQNNGRRINRKLHDFILLGKTLLAVPTQKRDYYETVESVFGWKELAASVGETEKLAAPLDFSNLDQLSSQYAQARQYAPRLLASLDFQGIPRHRSLLKAVQMLRALNQEKQSAIPPNAPREFVPRRWRPYVFDDQKIDRAYYELCVLNELSRALRSGDVWVPGSRRYRPFEEYLISPETWKAVQPDYSHMSGGQYLKDRCRQVHENLQRVSQLLADNQLPDVALENGNLRISPLVADVPEEVDLWSDRLYDLLPRIHLTDLLMEVDSWVRFSQSFTHLYTQQPASDRTLVLAVLLSDATNIGLTKIAEATPGRSYARLSWVADWYVREENYAKALAEIVRQQHRLPLASHWGPGTTSSSDGQAFPIATRKPVLAHTNAKYGRDPVVMLYSHISDRYAPFYTKVIRSTVRDATYVLDGLLDHGAGLSIEEHYTDTGGVSEHCVWQLHLAHFGNFIWPTLTVTGLRSGF